MYVCFTQGHGLWSSLVFCPSVTETDIQWMVYITQTSIWRKYKAFSFVCQTKRKKVSVLMCEEKCEWRNCMKGRKTFLNGEKSICNPHSQILPIQMPRDDIWKIRAMWNISTFINFPECQKLEYLLWGKEIDIWHQTPRIRDSSCCCSSVTKKDTS